MSSIIDYFRNFFRRRAFKKEINNLCQALESGVLDAFLELLLNAMSLAFLLDKDYRRHIRDFKGRYTFMSKDGGIAVSVIFRKNRMKVRKEKIDHTHVTVTFKDGEALRNFLFNKNPDIIGAVLDNDVTYEGNLNYLGKFAYMAKNLQLKFAA